MVKRYLLFISAVSLLTLMSSCDRRRTDKGYEYFPDMAHSLAYETYAPNPNVAGSESMLLPPPHTIPIEMQPYTYDKSIDSREKAARELINPLEFTEERLVRGKEQYNIFCAHCHGESGNGKGYLVTSGKYKFQPASLVSEKMKASNEADIFHVITVGFQVMGAHGHMIQPEDRWMIAMYVKKELQKQ
ncbi:MAG TPA: cytochrome c [Lentimicrobium sp.]|nr:cytochrome c [Lentimicrobium sp.]